RLMRAENAFGVVVYEALHRRDRALERLHHLIHRDLLGGTGQPVATMGAAGAHDQSSLAQTCHDLLEISERETLGLGDRLEARWLLGRLPAELDHQSHAVLRLRRKDHPLNPTSGVG